MIDQREVIWGVIAPPVLMAIGMVATAYLPVTRRFLSTGALLALVFGVCQLGFRGWPIPGGDVQNWPAWISFAAGLLSFCSVCGHGRLVWRIAARAAITGLATSLILRPQLQAMEVSTAVVGIAVLTIAWTTLVLLWERIHTATTPGVSLSNLVWLAGLSSASLLLFNCITHAQFAGILTAALTAALVLNWWRPASHSPTAVVTVVALVLPSLWLLGYRYANLPGWALPLLGAASLAPFIADFGCRSWAPWKRIVLTVIVILVIVSPVLAWGVITSIEAADKMGY